MGMHRAAPVTAPRPYTAPQFTGQPHRPLACSVPQRPRRLSPKPARPRVSRRVLCERAPHGDPYENCQMETVRESGTRPVRLVTAHRTKNRFPGITMFMESIGRPGMAV